MSWLLVKTSVFVTTNTAGKCVLTSHQFLLVSLVQMLKCSLEQRSLAPSALVPHLVLVLDVEQVFLRALCLNMMLRVWTEWSCLCERFFNERPEETEMKPPPLCGLSPAPGYAPKARHCVRPAPRRRPENWPAAGASLNMWMLYGLFLRAPSPLPRWQNKASQAARRDRNINSVRTSRPDCWSSLLSR